MNQTTDRKREKRQERVRKGLCPNCGKDAAPFYLCWECRQVRRVANALNRGVKTGWLTTRKEGNHRYYTKEGGKPRAEVDKRWETPIIPLDTDRRFLPRINRVPLEIENAVFEVFRSIGKPCTVDEVIEAWGRLREAGRRGDVVGSLRALIEAERRRMRKNQKRAG